LTSKTALLTIAVVGLLPRGSGRHGKGKNSLNRYGRAKTMKTRLKATTLMFLAVAALAATGALAAAATVTLDGRRTGRTFEGIGGLSAGACARLLLDYPEPQRSQVLDFLFKPSFGASLQHLKVEIGGDVNSTWGSEPSYARTREEFEHPRAEYFDRGYEWWLMREAKNRNPRIYLGVLQWGAPGWLGEKEFPGADDRRRFYSQDNADFIAGFIQGAKKYHGVDVNYCGVWNEKRHDSDWIKLLRKTLDRRGLSAVGIIGCDECGEGLSIVQEFPKDPELKKAIYALGTHYQRSTPAARQCGKPLWVSEDNGWEADGFAPGGGWSPRWAAGLAYARTLNLNYIQGRMTASIFCALMDAYCEAVCATRYPNWGPLRADEPWSGHYTVFPSLWAIAHTTQFVQPGWKYLDDACGLLADGGSYVCLRSPEAAGDYSIIIETYRAKKPQTLSFAVTGALAAGPLHLWRSNQQSQFQQQDDIVPRNGSFTLKAEPNCMYSLTTTAGQKKGNYDHMPPPADFPLPYHEDFESYAAGKTPKYFADQCGTFEVAQRPGGGKCLRQTVARRGIVWCQADTEAFTIIGGTTGWQDYEVSCDAYIEKAGYVAIFGRIQDGLKGYGLCVDDKGRWELKMPANAGTGAFCEVAVPTKTLAAGTTAFAAGRWHKLALRFSGPRIIASIDGAQLAAVEDRTFPAGLAGLGSGWNTALFDNFSLQP
jgi:galactosylceramidase